MVNGLCRPRSKNWSKTLQLGKFYPVFKEDILITSRFKAVSNECSLYAERKNKMKLLISIMALVLSLAINACGKDSKKSGPGKPKQKNEEKLDERSDKFGCVGPAEPGLTLLGTPWKQQWAGKNIEAYMTITFFNQFVEVRNTCVFLDGTRVTATVTSPVIIDSKSISFLEENEHTETKRTSTGDYNCTSSVHKGLVNYELVGSCLKVTANGQSDFLVK